ncbi:hypothetical protein C8F04DRAFT_1165515 [Mycena alexandri]|uniref:Uncharacterized protein n=1 Tax=Mycena alexandri TaxID=1745969 RepID=A0AAD6RW03_9AGAR|nr:hypothetical protein C8F04DRAFT_1165515 [Mycena alexandri]
MSTQTSWARWAATAGVRSARIACWMARGRVRYCDSSDADPPTANNIIALPCSLSPPSRTPPHTRAILSARTPVGMYFHPPHRPHLPHLRPHPPPYLSLFPVLAYVTHTAPARAVESMRDGTNCRLRKLALGGDAATHRMPCAWAEFQAHVDSRMRCLSSAPRRLFLLPTHNALHLLPHLHPHLPHPILVSPSLYTTAPPHNRREVEARRHLPSTQTRTRRGTPSS